MKQSRLVISRLLTKIVFQSGQSMIEVAIALAIATIIITALLTSVLSSLDSAQYSKNLNQATQYSQEGIEAIRAMGGPIADATYCMAAPNPPAPPALTPDTCDNVPNIDNFFRRRVTLDNLSGDCDGVLTKVEVVTAWTDGKCEGTPFCHTSRLTSCVSNL